MVVNSIVNNLKELGFSDYEARSYVALLQLNPATAYEIARTAEIPTSKIYQVIRKLEVRGVIQLHEQGEKKRYIPLAPQELLSSHQTRLESTLDSLQADFVNLKPRQEISYLWNLHDYSDLVDKALRMVRQAQQTLLLSLWQEEGQLLAGALAEGEKRGVKIAVVHFGAGSLQIGQIFPHPIEQTLYKEKGGRGFVLVADGREALLGTVYTGNQVEGAWSETRGFVMLAEDYIKHDVYIMKIVKRFDTELIARFGKGYQKLRDIFSDEEETYGNLH